MKLSNSDQFVLFFIAVSVGTLFIALATRDKTCIEIMLFIWVLALFAMVWNL